ncbi:RNA 2',3'-cyclic phosphodiesterase [Candidatus Bathyarchaeota archaeon]|nr:RNA 2',3'-cyclic phosphodiesterase [Candidatus Bathyarchaeota archaeon]
MVAAIRSFIAFDIDNQEVLNRMKKVQDLLWATGANVKAVKVENIHVTMRFLGNIAHKMVEQIFEEMKKVQFTSFEVKVRGVGAFPHLHRLNVIWAGLTEGADHMRNIFNQLEPSLRSLGFRADSKGFSPHITIARVRSARNKNELIECIKENADFEFGTVKAECLRLKRSDLTPQGPIYSTLKEFCPQL